MANIGQLARRHAAEIDRPDIGARPQLRRHVRHRIGRQSVRRKRVGDDASCAGARGHRGRQQLDHAEVLADDRRVRDCADVERAGRTGPDRKELAAGGRH